MADETPAEYPADRPSFFANRLIRLLQKSCAANDIGIEACWLVTCVALVEDAKHYSGPVTFWTGQLLPITGFNSWGRLDRARDKAVIGGWLHYQAGTNRKCGSYWTLIPKSILLAFDDSPIDEVNHQNGDSSKVNHQNGAHNGDRNVIETGLKRDNAVNLPSLLPVPVPEERGAALPSPPKSKFQKPTAEQVKAYAVERSSPEFNADYFIDHYESNGWRVGKSAMKDWKATVRKWISNGGTTSSAKASTSMASNSDEAETEWARLLKGLLKFDLQTQRDELKSFVGQRIWMAATNVTWSRICNKDQFNESKVRGDFLTAWRAQ